MPVLQKEPTRPSQPRGIAVLTIPHPQPSQPTELLGPARDEAAGGVLDLGTLCVQQGAGPMGCVPDPRSIREMGQGVPGGALG